MCFSHMLCSPWYARYEVTTLLMMLIRCIDMILVAMGYIRLWTASFCENAIWSSLVSRMPLMFKLGAYSYILLNSFLEPCSFHLGSKIHLSSWMFSLHATLWRSLSFFLPQRHFMYCLTCKSWILYVRCLCLKKIVLPCLKCFKFLISGAKLLHNVHQWEVSYLEVDTWLSGFDMTWDSL
jgi:hypothetical protein